MYRQHYGTFFDVISRNNTKFNNHKNYRYDGVTTDDVDGGGGGGDADADEIFK